MSTRSFIGQVVEGQKVRYVYCHFDGYPQGVGATLLEHYTDTEKVSQLIDLGGLSCLGPDIGHQVDFDTFHTAPENGLQCLAYTRDRGEPWKENKPTTCDGREAYLAAMDEAWTEYAYLWNGQHWEIAQATTGGFLMSDVPNLSFGRFMPLRELLEPTEAAEDHHEHDKVKAARLIFTDTDDNRLYDFCSCGSRRLSAVDSNAAGEWFDPREEPAPTAA